MLGIAQPFKIIETKIADGVTITQIEPKDGQLVQFTIYGQIYFPPEHYLQMYSEEKCLQELKCIIYSCIPKAKEIVYSTRGESTFINGNWVSIVSVTYYDGESAFSYSVSDRLFFKTPKTATTRGVK